MPSSTWPPTRSTPVASTRTRRRAPSPAPCSPSWVPARSREARPHLRERPPARWPPWACIRWSRRPGVPGDRGPTGQDAVVNELEGNTAHLAGHAERDAGTEHHRIALDDQFVDLTQQRAGQARAAGQPDPRPGPVLEPAHQLDRITGHDLDPRVWAGRQGGRDHVLVQVREWADDPRLQGRCVGVAVHHHGVEATAGRRHPQLLAQVRRQGLGIVRGHELDDVLSHRKGVDRAVGGGNEPVQARPEVVGQLANSLTPFACVALALAGGETARTSLPVPRPDSMRRWASAASVRGSWSRTSTSSRPARTASSVRRKACPARSGWVALKAARWAGLIGDLVTEDHLVIAERAGCVELAGTADAADHLAGAEQPSGLPELTADSASGGMPQHLFAGP